MEAQQGGCLRPPKIAGRAARRWVLSTSQVPLPSPVVVMVIWMLREQGEAESRSKHMHTTKLNARGPCAPVRGAAYLLNK